MPRKHPWGNVSVFIYWYILHDKLTTLAFVSQGYSNKYIVFNIVSLLHKLPLIQELYHCMNHHYFPVLPSAFHCRHNSNNVYLDNNLLDTLPKPIHHLYCNPRESKHHHNFSNSTGFVNMSAQFPKVCTFLRATPPPSIAYLTKWYLTAIFLVLLW